MNNVVVTKAPFRISLAGGGTDITSYCSRFGGQVIGFSIDRYVVTTLLPRNFYDENHVISGDNELLPNFSTEAKDYVLHALSETNLKHKFKASILTDAPPNTGLGGSAAFLNSFISASKNIVNTNLTKSELAELSSRVEIEKLKRPVGKQDHYLSALGGMNLLTFDKSLTVTASKITVKEQCKNYLNSRLLLFYTNIKRSAGDVLSDQSNQISRSNLETTNLMHDIKSLVMPMLSALENDKPDEIGCLLAEHWHRKKSLTKNNEKDEISQLISLCYKSGADGCKILGAGGGGFILVSAKEGMQQKIRDELAKYNIIEFKFNIEFDGTSSTKIPI
ncbi:D-glycero-alpha-D-manno-heptose-7-phosphate kinase [Paenibacillus sp. 4624]|uniref:Uncharacterized protein n=1 Tax=Paenibacillus amylolyticus TaxID=1451 RepID=A0A5M9WQV3_PAEAM|nr:hypothetical protein [Paenibacillus amylolyticus]KAA8783808.1 hypothetical protein EC604_08105 [Paenibacillus amylolyticus]